MGFTYLARTPFPTGQLCPLKPISMLEIKCFALVFSTFRSMNLKLCYRYYANFTDKETEVQSFYVILFNTGVCQGWDSSSQSTYHSVCPSYEVMRPVYQLLHIHILMAILYNAYM